MGRTKELAALADAMATTNSKMHDCQIFEDGPCHQPGAMCRQRCNLAYRVGFADPERKPKRKAICSHCNGTGVKYDGVSLNVISCPACQGRGVIEL